MGYSSRFFWLFCSKSRNLKVEKIPPPLDPTHSMIVSSKQLLKFNFSLFLAIFFLKKVEIQFKNDSLPSLHVTIIVTLFFPIALTREFQFLTYYLAVNTVTILSALSPA